MQLPKKKADTVVARDNYIEKQDASIKAGQHQLDVDKKILAETSDEITRLTLKSKNLETKIAALDDQVGDLITRKSAIIEARKNDAQSFAKRQTRDENAVNALKKIIPKLTALLKGDDSFVQKSKMEVQAALRKLPKNHPVEALVELTTQLSSAKLKFVIGKLTDILEAITLSAAEDQKNEEASATKFGKLLAEVNDVIKTKQGEHIKAKQDNIAVNDKLEVLVSKRTNLKENISTQEKLLATKKEQKTKAVKAYQDTIDDANDSVNSLTAALKVLTKGREQLNKAANDADGAF